MTRTISKLFLCLALALFWAGCATTEITNLTPSTYPRNPNGQYMIEMELDTKQQTMLPETIKPQVVIGFDSYPMQRTKKTQNRWEALVPVPANKESIQYHFKANYEYQGFGRAHPDSISSRPYLLFVK